jgi:Domain of unknown function (DUF4349)
MEPFRDDTGLAAELQALRPAPSQAFAAELDERAAAGFPHRSALRDSPLGRLATRLRALPPRRLLLPAGATALAALAVATALVAIAEPGNGGDTRLSLSSPQTRSGRAGEGETLSNLNRFSRGANGEASAASAKSSNHNGSVLQYSAAAPSTATSGSAPSSTGPNAVGTRHREVERSAEIVLGTTPSEVHEVANQVLQTVHAYRGIVLRSSIHDVGEADSTFDLLIPSSKLSDALAGFSEAGEVLSRSESTADVTARAIGLGERLQDAEATVKGLLAQLATAESDSEREVVEAELHSARRHAASLRSRLSSLQRRVHFSRVSLRIESKPGAVTGTNRWGLSDALRDAGHILTIAAGVAIVGLAVLGPLALIALLAWLARRAWVRRERERALSTQSP